MSRPTQRAGFVFVAFLFTFVWHVSQADPFLPLGSNPSGSQNEAALHGVNSGLVWRTPSLLYVYVVTPNNSDPTNESLWEYKKAIFFPLVHRIAKLTIPNTYLSLTQNSSISPHTFMYVSGFGLNSTRKNYFQRIGSDVWTIGSYSLVVEMEKGTVKKFTWIDGCSECNCGTATDGTSITCPESVCITNDCSINHGDCIAKGSNTCDMKFFVGWVGEDKNNRPCTSSGSLPYNFLQFGLTPVYRAAAGVTNQYLFNISKIGSLKPTS